jgi:hypothetical protein
MIKALSTEYRVQELCEALGLVVAARCHHR